MSESEGTSFFNISHSLEWNNDAVSTYINEFSMGSIEDEERILDSIFIDRDKIEDLWYQKDRLSEVYSSGEESLYLTARNREFPAQKVIYQGRKKRYLNRAAYKLLEIFNLRINVTEFTDEMNDTRFFLDVAGGPGSWSEVIFDKYKDSVGIGMTLKLDPDKKLDWNEVLKQYKFHPIYGEDDTGNLYNNKNIDALVTESKDISIREYRRYPEKESMLYSSLFDSVVGDGGFSVPPDPITGESRENLQELFHSRLILSEFLSALRTLKEGGYFICKLFDCFTTLSVSTIYLMTYLFESVFIVKTPTSRGVNSERYIVCISYTSEGNIREQIILLFNEAHRNWFNNDESLFSLVPVNIMKQDMMFKISYGTMLKEMTSYQHDSLKKVLDLVDDMREALVEIRKLYDITIDVSSLSYEQEDFQLMSFQEFLKSEMIDVFNIDPSNIGFLLRGLENPFRTLHNPFKFRGTLELYNVNALTGFIYVLGQKNVRYIKYVDTSDTDTAFTRFCRTVNKEEIQSLEGHGILRADYDDFFPKDDMYLKHSLKYIENKLSDCTVVFSSMMYGVSIDQVRTALKVCRREFISVDLHLTGGNYVVKFSYVPDSDTMVILYGLSKLFEELYIVKPLASDITKNTLYAVFINMFGDADKFSDADKFIEDLEEDPEEKLISIRQDRIYEFNAYVVSVLNTTVQRLHSVQSRGEIIDSSFPYVYWNCRSNQIPEISTPKKFKYRHKTH